MKNEGSESGEDSGVLANYPVDSSGIAPGLVQALDWFIQDKVSLDAIRGQLVDAVQEQPDMSAALMKLLAFVHQGEHLSDDDYRMLVADIDDARVQEQPTQSYFHPVGVDQGSNVVELATRARSLTLDEVAGQGLREGMVLKNRYVIQERADDGGMGVVYKALDKRREEAGAETSWVAIKVLSEPNRNLPEARQALEREAAKVQQLSHPNIVNVFDFDRDGDEFFMVMEWLEGEQLTALLQRHRSAPLSRTVALRMLRSIARGLAHAHQHGVAHADVKPANIYITRDRQVKVLDFGLARAINGNEPEDRSDVTGFTPAYASCEVLEGALATPHDDVYALGCIAYRLLTGNHPFGNMKATEAEAQDLAPAVIDGLPMGSWEAIERALAFRREDRTANAAIFLEELNPRQRKDKGEASGFGAGKLFQYGLPVAALIISVATALTWWGSREAEPPVRPLEAEAQPSAATLLDQARVALDAGRVTDPPQDNAYYYYRKVLEINPGDPVAATGLDLIAQSSLSALDTAMTSDNLQEAVGLLGVLNTVAPENEAVKTAQDQLNSRAATSLEQALQIQEEAELPAAETMVDQAALILGEDSPTVIAARTQLTERFSSGAKLATLMTEFDASLAQDKLLSGAGDPSAKSYLLEAQSLDPESPLVQQGAERLTTALVLQGMIAVSTRDFANAEVLISEAKTLGVQTDAVSRVEQELTRARRGERQRAAEAERLAQQATAEAAAAASAAEDTALEEATISNADEVPAEPELQTDDATGDVAGDVMQQEEVIDSEATVAEAESVESAGDNNATDESTDNTTDTDDNANANAMLLLILIQMPCQPLRSMQLLWNR